MSNEPFGRQPLPVTVIIVGQHELDVAYWHAEFSRRAGFKGDLVHQHHMNGLQQTFVIYPRAVND